ncbi:hypothetical protein Anapl_00879 [Anas platyrhynchos]|uniref:Uncharacterized protein n=1 Tax=Anas platyrhynchos TaxID=8839 RepID=R0JZL0_ANAPL|nr:hypothetical protein Anapl_00879 [Anas platyrhynchos]
MESSDQIKATLKLELIGSLNAGVIGEMKERATVSSVCGPFVVERDRCRQCRPQNLNCETAEQRERFPNVLLVTELKSENCPSGSLSSFQCFPFRQYVTTCEDNISPPKGISDNRDKSPCTSVNIKLMLCDLAMQKAAFMASAGRQTVAENLLLHKRAATEREAYSSYCAHRSLTDMSPYKAEMPRCRLQERGCFAVVCVTQLKSVLIVCAVAQRVLQSITACRQIVTQFVVVLLLLFLKWHQSLKPEIETVSAADSSPCKPKQQLVKDKGLLGLLCLGEMC